MLASGQPTKKRHEYEASNGTQVRLNPEAVQAERCGARRKGILEQEPREMLAVSLRLQKSQKQPAMANHISRQTALIRLASL